MHTTLELVLDPTQADDPAVQRAEAASALGLDLSRITELRLRRRSLDARGRAVRVRLLVEVWCDEAAPPEEPLRPDYPLVHGPRRVVIVGSGPAGLFAALRCIERGVRPIVLDRGKDVQARRHDLAGIQKRGRVDPDSNYCFGEGGAGTYSDGKLYTRATKRGSVEAVLRTLVAHGAPEQILIESHPHIGSNRLPKVVAAMRRSILEAGGEVHFGARVTQLLRDAHGRVVGVATANGDEWQGEAVILATGHSARDVFRLLVNQDVRLEAKPFAVGVRVEHPQPLIDSIQYHGPRPTPLPAASYRLASTVDERGVFSFCMCPGGFIVPAATEDDEIVVNGMSLSRRDSPFANSGIVVAVEAPDLERYARYGALAGIALQKSLEVRAALAGGGMQRAPGQRLTDFVDGRDSADLPDCSYHPGLTPAPLHEILPPGLAHRLRAGFRNFGGTMRGYLTDEAVVVGVETRTSSPVRIPRDPKRCEHPEVPGLYPCGEGAGYAGGIVSAALDGLRVAEAVVGGV